MSGPEQLLERLVGQANEVDAKVEGRPCRALLDSGSVVSTISDVLCQELGLQIHSIDDFLKVHGAGEHNLRCLGYVDIGLEFPDLNNKAEGALLLVVPETTYHGLVPLLIGTNVLNWLKPRDEVELPTAWKLAFKGMVNQQRIETTDCSLGSVKTTKEVVISAGDHVMVHGITRAASTACMRLSVMVEEPVSSSLPGGLVVSPGFAQLRPGVSSQ